MSRWIWNTIENQKVTHIINVIIRSDVLTKCWYIIIKKKIIKIKVVFEGGSWL